MYILAINEIADFTKEQNYLGACTAYFKFIHKRMPDKLISHPNVYFAESRVILANNATGIMMFHIKKLHI